MRAIWMAAIFLSGTAQAFDLPNLGALGQSKTSFRYSGSYQPGDPVSIHQESLNASVPMWKNETDAVAVGGRAGVLDVGANSVGLTDLYEFSVNSTYTHGLGEGRAVGINASFGTASDHPFEDSSVNTIGATVFYAFPSAPKSHWVLLVNYSNNRPILNNIPLPGFVYSYAPSKEFRLSVGAPFASLNWQFAERWSLSMFTLVPWVVRTSVAYQLVGPVQVFTAFDFSQQTYFRLGRANSKERIFYDEKRVTVGVRSPLSQSFLAELETGVALGRRFFDAESYGSDKTREVELPSGWLLRAGLSANF